ncbi:TolC family outer membrane protein [Vibrio parahaemolyticus]|uniref:TolC family outer membrane protein n=1 Tax=Vibrio parahaemolyticus TaxID=670 RepID=A0A9Q3YIS4_VIBPH|nr:TolC family outer membrane protein [Vibrio parahaemolyticus]EGQ7799108.1 TolC family outer membrane protein [Vibrio parahaemolyticus]EGQ7948420.1 TolC family outer membrane protein [Vibrio parahaemolyticus]EGQ8110617.1 TolC family outer membrane protein [Vibrio parahaemolyticus]EGQ8196161.1 TolC family outer membrane protein [Vibrio parahaemolyticus]EGQ8547145.1 TolC family outer membrane protein [Vibrio parahaemolyticus]
MKWTRANAFCIGVFAASHAFGQTLEQAVENTLKTNPDIKSAFNEFVSKQYVNEASGGAYLPSVDLDAGIGYEGINPAESGRDSTDLTRKEATITLTQLIWDGSATLNDMDRTAADAESVRYQLLADAQDAALEVTKVYLDSVKAYEILSLSENNLKVHKKIYEDIKKRVNSGIGSTADLTQVEARLAKAHGNLVAAQNNLFDSQTMFTRLVGQSPQGLIFPRADQNFIPYTIDEAIDLAFESHPVIKISVADVDSAKFQYKQSKGTYYPTISVEAAQTWRNDAGGIEGSSDETTAMLRMRYNLFNGGSDVANAESFAYQLNKAKDLRERAYRNVEEGLRLSWSALDLTLQQKEFLADHVDSASETVIAYEKQYRIGKRTLLDLLNTENELFEARKNYLDAKYAEQYAKYRVMNATGQLLNALRVDVPTEWNQKVEY